MVKLSQVKNKILVVLVLIFIILSFIFFQKEAKSFFYFISSPIQKVFWKAGDGISNFFGTIIQIQKLQKENEELIIKNQELLSENSQLKELKKENDTLRKAMNLKLQEDFKLEMAEVIAKDPFQDIILINKGKNSGLKPGMPILTGGRALLGKIFEVYDNFSKVLLISDKSSSFDAKILAPYLPTGRDGAGVEKDIYGVIKGEGNLSLIFDLIPQDKEVKEGDLIVTSSLAGIFPKGLLTGEIKEIQKSDIKPYQKAALEPFFNLEDLEIVFIITNF